MNTVYSFVKQQKGIYYSLNFQIVEISKDVEVYYNDINNKSDDESYFSEDSDSENDTFVSDSENDTFVNEDAYLFDNYLNE
tara:strand:- start:235 stop:477 length:243 start_codon:yes stop_codon:yes gene_type:complete